MTILKDLIENKKLVGQRWEDVNKELKDELLTLYNVDNDNVDEDGRCIVDWDGIAVIGKKVMTENETYIEIDDSEIIYETNLEDRINDEIKG